MLTPEWPNLNWIICKDLVSKEGPIRGPGGLQHMNRASEGAPRLNPQRNIKHRDKSMSNRNVGVTGAAPTTTAQDEEQRALAPFEGPRPFPRWLGQPGGHSGLVCCVALSPHPHVHETHGSAAIRHLANGGTHRAQLPAPSMFVRLGPVAEGKFLPRETPPRALAWTQACCFHHVDADRPLGLAADPCPQSGWVGCWTRWEGRPDFPENRKPSSQVWPPSCEQVSAGRMELSTQRKWSICSPEGLPKAHGRVAFSGCWYHARRPSPCLESSNGPAGCCPKIEASQVRSERAE